MYIQLCFESVSSTARIGIDEKTEWTVDDDDDDDAPLSADTTDVSTKIWVFFPDDMDKTSSSSSSSSLSSTTSSLSNSQRVEAIYNKYCNKHKENNEKKTGLTYGDVHCDHGLTSQMCARRIIS